MFILLMVMLRDDSFLLLNFFLLYSFCDPAKFPPSFRGFIFMGIFFISSLGKSFTIPKIEIVIKSLGGISGGGCSLNRV